MMTGMTTLERYNAMIELGQHKAAARERLQANPPEIGKFAPARQAALPTTDGLEFVQAHHVFVRLWGPCSIGLGVCKDDAPKARLRWRCFHWNTGAFIAYGKTKMDAVWNALVVLERHGQDEFNAAIDAMTESHGGHLN